MPDRRSDDDPFVSSWRDTLERMRREEGTRSWRESDTGHGRPRVVVPSDEGERHRRSRRRRRLAAGLVVFLVGLGAYLVLSGRIGSALDAPVGGGETPSSAAADRMPAPVDTVADVMPGDTAPPGRLADSVSSPADTVAAATPASPTVGGSGPDTAATPELLDLFLGDSATVARAMRGDAEPGAVDSALVVRPGPAGALWVGVRGAEGRPRAGVELVLEGSDRLPGVDERLEVTTDGRGRAAFRFPVGEVRDTLAMHVLARGYWLRGTNRVIVRPVP